MRGILFIIYISESKVTFIDSLLQKFSQGPSKSVKVVHSFTDNVYNRTSFYLASQPNSTNGYDELLVEALDLCAEAFAE